MTVATEDLDAISEDSVYEVWLVDNVPGVHNSAAMDLGEGGDTILSLGALPPSGSLTTFVDLKELAGFEVDLAAVMRISPEREPEFIIGGMQSIVFQLNRQAKLAEDHSSTLTGLLDYWLGRPVFADPQPHISHTPGGNGNGDLITQGEELFFTTGTFGGNGRTCGTCHRVDNDLAIDVDFIATLEDDPMELQFDLLFIAESDPFLPPFVPNNPTIPAFEFPAIMKSRGLILENINGFEEDAAGILLEPPVFRAVPSLFNLSFTAPFGYSACCADLRIFAMGAVKQHFPKTLDRMAGVTDDFVFPTEAELDALEAFMLSKESPADGNFKFKGNNNPNVITDAEKRGRSLFNSVGCKRCHGGTVLSGGNLNTGVETLELDHPDPTPTEDLDINGNPRAFQTPPLFALRKPFFFHNNAVEGLLAAVAFYDSLEFTGSPTGGQVTFDPDTIIKNQQIADIAAFLEGLARE